MGRTRNSGLALAAALVTGGTLTGFAPPGPVTPAAFSRDCHGVNFTVNIGGEALAPAVASDPTVLRVYRDGVKIGELTSTARVLTWSHPEPVTGALNYRAEWQGTRSGALAATLAPYACVPPPTCSPIPASSTAADDSSVALAHGTFGPAVGTQATPAVVTPATSATPAASAAPAPSVARAASASPAQSVSASASPATSAGTAPSASPPASPAASPASSTCPAGEPSGVASPHGSPTPTGSYGPDCPPGGDDHGHGSGDHGGPGQHHGHGTPPPPTHQPPAHQPPPPAHQPPAHQPPAHQPPAGSGHPAQGGPVAAPAPQQPAQPVIQSRVIVLRDGDQLAAPAPTASATATGGVTVGLEEPSATASSDSAASLPGDGPSAPSGATQQNRPRAALFSGVSPWNLTEVALGLAILVLAAMVLRGRPGSRAV